MSTIQMDSLIQFAQHLWNKLFSEITEIRNAEKKTQDLDSQAQEETEKGSS